jgi:hypothetical protein
MSTRVEIEAGGFAVREAWWRRRTVKWSAVTAIHALQAERVTYREIFLVFELADGTSISVGELDKGFAAFRDALADTFPDMEMNWYTLAEPYAGEPVQVWSRSISAS